VSLKLSSSATGIVSASYCDLFSGGSMNIYDKDGNSLVTLKFSDPAFTVPKDGRAYIVDPLSGVVKKSGIAVSYTCFHKNEMAVESGTVGVCNADLTLHTTKLSSGDVAYITYFCRGLS
jgi:hypothetical protein